jgi:uncharacterized membrane protein HdeD (DUF308 family)
VSENPDARREIPHQVIDDWPLPLGVVSVVGWICAVPLVFTPGVVLVFLLPFVSVAAIVTGILVLRRLRGSANSRKPAITGLALGALSLVAIIVLFFAVD